MKTVGKLLTGLAAAESLFIALIEMRRWEEKGASFFPEPHEGFFRDTVVMAGNQGLYNGFLGAGMLWGLLRRDTGVCLFFLACMLTAAGYGCATTSRKIILQQGTVPAAALAAIALGK